MIIIKDEPRNSWVPLAFAQVARRYERASAHNYLIIRLTMSRRETLSIPSEKLERKVGTRDRDSKSWRVSGGGCCSQPSESIPRAARRNPSEHEPIRGDANREQVDRDAAARFAEPPTRRGKIQFVERDPRPAGKGARRGPRNFCISAGN